MRNKLLNLLARNARKGEFRAEGNTIYLYDVIVSTEADASWWGGVSAEAFVPMLKAMTGDVDIRVNSPGGDVFGAKAMAQAIREYPGNVTVHVDGYAASAATFVTSAADKTLMAPGSLMMIHEAWTIAMGNAGDFTATANLLSKIDGTIAETYAAAATARGVEPPDFGALMAAETWFTPAEAIAAGLADEQDGEVEDTTARARWDVTAYAKAPKTENAPPAPEPEPVAPPAPPANDQIEEPVRPNLRADLLLRPAA
jgi:ATP-dependent Clp protease protease subunit